MMILMLMLLKCDIRNSMIHCASMMTLNSIVFDDCGTRTFAERCEFRYKNNQTDEF